MSPNLYTFSLSIAFFVGFLDHFLTKPTHIFVKARFKCIQICITHIIFNLSTRTAWKSYEAKASKTQNKLNRIWGPNNHFYTFILLSFILFYCRQQLKNYYDLCIETGNLHTDWIISVLFCSSFCINMHSVNMKVCLSKLELWYHSPMMQSSLFITYFII